jgi:hypothetical protein
LYLHWLDEDTANFLQDLILEDLGFDPETHRGEFMQDRAFYPHFKRWERKRFVDYVAGWNNANFKAPQFVKTFLQFLNSLNVERHPIENLAI